MSDIPTPRQLIETLLPNLRVAAAYAQQIQTQIAVHPDKYESENFFANALTDADLSIQTFIEVALLGNFPQVRFYGEEYEKSYNTKYFRAIDLGPPGDYLITLDPIDGTQFYMDGHGNYHIILTLVDANDYAAVIAVNPAQQTYYYGFSGEGTFVGSLDMDLEACVPLRVENPLNRVYLSWGMGHLANALKDEYEVIDVRTSYSKEQQIPNPSGILNGELTGVILERGKLIDGAAFAFLAREAGCIVTTLEGKAPPPPHMAEDYTTSSLIVASSPQVHQNLLMVVQGDRSGPSNQ